MMVNTETLIGLVREHSEIWDKSIPQYRDKLAKSNAWHEIFKGLDPNYDSLDKTARHEYGIAVMKKWNNVRDAYVKSVKNQNSLYKRTRPYIHTDRLSFLDTVTFNEKFFEKRMNTSEDDDIEVQDVSNIAWETDAFVDINEDPTTSEPLSKKSKTSDPDDLNDNVVAVLARLIQKEEDEDRAFFKSITPAVKSLSEEAKFEFRVEVMNLVQRLKKNDRKAVKLKYEIETDCNDVESD